MMRIGILLFDGVDLLDVSGPYEVFLTAARLQARDRDEPTFEVVTLTTDGAPVVSYGGMGLSPHSSIADAGPLDMVIVPGTIDLDAVLTDDAFVDTVRTLHARVAVTASVCTGAFLLAAAGVLQDEPWTTHWEDIDALEALVGAEGARRGVRWVDAGTILTAGGLSSGIAMALHIVARFASPTSPTAPPARSTTTGTTSAPQQPDSTPHPQRPSGGGNAPVCRKVEPSLGPRCRTILEQCNRERRSPWADRAVLETGCLYNLRQCRPRNVNASGPTEKRSSPSSRNRSAATGLGARSSGT